ncbi:hypothetical protein PWEIH_14756 [Listeria weihenstephanensis FSL R9-0317]|uniref:Uncharacterized protein n=1 Tax=Listeria weihenstephanensis TaxID=1006155 RepID=A0A1S7FVT9_9LIST|nr:hypothetical protein [Listeria weihenstephanensis]AQY51457.1 hypothetical protein UE46_10690 [Listeria weihenstephanensis]EUJ35813.1 hypothetical protein PWEIH_14756 [Listeria weihenstephanensis FSL R9-0317]
MIAIKGKEGSVLSIKKYLVPILIIAAVAAIVVVFLVTKEDDPAPADSELNLQKISNPIFLKSNGYISLHKGETFSLSLPFLIGETNIDKISEVTFDTPDLQAEVDDITENKDSKDAETKIGYINLNISSDKVGQFTAQKMTLVSGDRSVTVNIGELIFDVDASKPPADLTFAGAGVQASMKSYHLEVQNKDKFNAVKIKRVEAKTDAMLLQSIAFSVPPGNEAVSHELDLNTDSSKYLWFILKPKVTYVASGQEAITSGYPTYLGLSNWSEKKLNTVIKNKGNSEYK